MNSGKKTARPTILTACNDAGGQEALAKLIGESQQFVWHLLYRAKSIKADVAMKISGVTNLTIEEIIEDFKETEAA